MNTYLRSLRESHSHLVDEYDTLIGRKTLIDTLEERCQARLLHRRKYRAGMRYDRDIISREDIITKILAGVRREAAEFLNETLVARFFDRPRPSPSTRRRIVPGASPTTSRLLLPPRRSARLDGITEAVSNVHRPLPSLPRSIRSITTMTATRQAFYKYIHTSNTLQVFVGGKPLSALQPTSAPSTPCWRLSTTPRRPTRTSLPSWT